MTMTFKVRSALRRRRWAKYWAAQEDRNHVEYFRLLAEDWRRR